MEAEGARTFLTSGDAYDSFMGRYSRPLAVEFLDAVGVTAGLRALDVGCGPGALTGALVDRLGADAVAAADPSPPFVAECARRHPGVDVRLGPAEAIPFDDGSFDVVLAQLVLHFVTDPEAAGREFRRVLRPEGVAAACVWDFAEGMQMLRFFWYAAVAIQDDAPDEARTLRFGRPGEIVELLEAAGFEGVTEVSIGVRSAYADFDELWAGFQAGIGPAGAFCRSLPDDRRAALRHALFERVGSPTGGFELSATARAAHGRAPA
jgi:SAM-dependent methyltransferase